MLALVQQDDSLDSRRIGTSIFAVRDSIRRVVFLFLDVLDGLDGAHNASKVDKRRAFFG